MSKTPRRMLGDYGEELACRWYEDKGYVVVDRNVNIARVGEIDIVARNAPGSLLICAEVKTRSSHRFGHGYEAIDYRKLMKMRRCAYEYVRRNQCGGLVRIDVVSIALDRCDIQVFEDI